MLPKGEAGGAPAPAGAAVVWEVVAGGVAAWAI